MTEQLAWMGSAAEGRLELLSPGGETLVFHDLPSLAKHLTQRGDPCGGFVACASALGIALYCMQHANVDTPQAIDTAGKILENLVIPDVLARMQACAQHHAWISNGAERAARLVLEARRFQRQSIEVQAPLFEKARSVLSRARNVLLAWPGGSACDLGEGLLTGTIRANLKNTWKASDIVITGPTELALSAQTDLAKQGIASTVLDAIAAEKLAASGSLGAVLLRTCGQNLAENLSVSLATLATKRRVPVLALGIDRAFPADFHGKSAVLSPLPSGCQTHLGVILPT